MLKNPIALVKDTGELIHISEYKESEHAGDIICPNCKSEMIVKAINSGKIITHFAHINLEDCYGYESVLHDWAKNRFTHMIGKKIVLPSVMDSMFNSKQISKIKREIENSYIEYRKSIENEIRSSNIFVKGWYFKNYFEKPEDMKNWIRNEFAKFLNKPITELEMTHEILIEKAEVEVPVDNGTVITDVIINDKYGIEIYVSHKVDDEKKNILKEIGLNSIEIDLSKCDREFFEKEKIEDIMLKETSNKNVFGTFEDIRGVKYSISDTEIQEFKNKVTEKAKEFLRVEIDSLKQTNDDKLAGFYKMIKDNPNQFFINYAIKQNISVDYKQKKYVDEKLISMGYPVLNDNGHTRYEYPLEGSIQKIIQVTEYNRLKVQVTCEVFIKNFNEFIILDLIYNKGEFKKSKDSLIAKKFCGIRRGWHGVELIFDKMEE